MQSSASSTEALPRWDDIVAPPFEPAVDVIKFRETPEGKALIDWAKKNYTACKFARNTEERQWKFNLAMYNGLQYAELMRAGTLKGEILQKPARADENRETVNRVEPLVRTEMARILAQRPSASVLPASADDEDMFAAMAGEQVWESQYRNGKVHDVMTRAAFWLVITGNGFIRTTWDDVSYDNNAEASGKICYDSVNPFNFFIPDVREEDIEKQAYVLNAYTKTPEWLRMAYPKELQGVDLTPNANAANEFLDETWLQIQGAKRPDPDQVIVYEYWVKPNSVEILPGGGHLVFVDGAMLAYTPGFPYKHGEFPFAHMGHIPTGKFYRRSVLNSVNGLQKEYNKTRTQISRAATKMGNPQLLAQKGSISTARMSNQTGLIIEYKPGYERPTPMPMAEVPQYVQSSLDRVLVDIEDISGQHQVSKGNVPPGVTAATAISYLQEKDDSYLSLTYTSVESGMEKVARQTLSLAVEMWDVPRLIKTVGEDGSVDTLFLAGSDIENGTDIRVEPGSALPTSKAAKQAFVMDLMDRGYIPPQDGLEMLDIGDSQKMLDQLRSDKRQAQRENIRMKSIDPEMIMQDEGQVDPMSGMPIPAPPVISVNTWDNHKVHIEVHNRYRRGQAFEFLPDEVKAQFELHIQLHKQAMYQENIENMLLGIPTDGSVEGPSGVMQGGPAEDAMIGAEGMEELGAGPDQAAEAAPSSEEAII